MIDESKLPDFLTPEQVAELLQVHQRTVLRHIQSGELRAVRFGHIWRVPREALLDALKPNWPEDESD